MLITFHYCLIAISFEKTNDKGVKHTDMKCSNSTIKV